MIIVIVSGADGAGKTSLIQECIAQLAEMGITSRRTWIRWGRISSVPILALNRFLRTRATGKFDMSDAGGSILELDGRLSLAYGHLQLVDMASWLWLTKLVHTLRRTEVLFVDRYIPDMLVDITQKGSLSTLSSRFARSAIRWARRAGSLWVVDVSAAEVIRRRPGTEATVDIQKMVEAYQFIARHYQIPVLNASTDPLSARTKLIEWIMSGRQRSVVTR